MVLTRWFGVTESDADRCAAREKSDIEEIAGYWQDALGVPGRKFLFGEFSIADCMYAPVVSRFRTYGIALPPLLEEYCNHVWTLPAMNDWLIAAQNEVEQGLPKPAA